MPFKTAEERRAYHKKWRDNNPERVRSYSKKYRATNRAKKTEYERQWRADNPEKARAHVRKWSAAHPNRSRDNIRKRKYGLTPAQYQALVASQNSLCAICLRDLTTMDVGDVHIDHDHSTNKVRGILCRLCNMLLGGAKDDRTILYRAISYLTVHKRLHARLVA